MKAFLAAALLLAGCTIPVSITPTAVPNTATPSPAPTEVVYPIRMTVVPRAVFTINVLEAGCRSKNTDYLVWPYELKVVFHEDRYTACLALANSR